MLEVTERIATRRTVEDAFAYVADGYFDHQGRYDPDVTGMTKTSDGPVAAGTTGIETRRFVGTMKAAFEVTAFERPSRFGLRNTSGQFELDRAYAFETAPEGSTVSFTFRMRPRAAPVRWIFPAMRGPIAKRVRRNIQRLRSELDAGRGLAG